MPSTVTFTVPVVPEPTFAEDESYFWSTTVKDATNQLNTAVTGLAEDVRQAYGMIYVNDASDAQNVGTTPSKITGFTTNGPTLRCISDHTNDQLTVVLPGVYQVAAQISFSGSPSVTFDAHIRVNGGNTNLGFHRAMGTAGDVGSASILGLLDCEEDDDISLYIASSSDGKNATLVDAQLSATLLS